MLTKMIINLVIFIIFAIAATIYLKKVKFEQKGYKLLFIVYTCFWLAPMLLRPYAGTLQKSIMIDYVWIALASYGFVGIFMRPFADIFNFQFRSRKAFLYFSCIIQIICFLPVIIMPNTATSILQSVGVGIGASCIGSFQLLFKEQYNQQKAYLTVSLLSIPPLLADFLTAPLQSLLMAMARTDQLVEVNTIKYLWLFGIIFSVAALILIYFVKEDKKKFDSIKNTTFIFKKDGTQLILLCILGSLITFIKFSNSGSVGTLHLQTLGELMKFETTVYEGYLSVLFSCFQLIGGVIVGTYLIKKYNNFQIFGLGASIWLIYVFIAMFGKHPLTYFFANALNGLAYGILYNFILGAILNSSFRTRKITPMGIYQAILAVGITVSNAFTQIIRNNLTLNYQMANMIINGVILLSIILMICIYYVNWRWFQQQRWIKTLVFI